ncbi:MAG: hypothetical protein IT210_24345 [Armatimonadetes bacterium]|nr:hypothetical protein [Armatimonadota bacterium]
MSRTVLCRIGLMPLLLPSLLLCSPARAGYGGEGPSDGEAEWARKHVGMYIWGPSSEKEQAGYGRETLSEMAARLGTRIVRSTINMHLEPWRSDYDPTARSYIDYLRRPDWKSLIARHDVIVLTLGDGSGRQFEPTWTKEHFRRLTEYLLHAYAGAGKTFILGLWEGDHWLTEKEMAGNPAAVEKFARYFAARRDGILAGRAAVPRSRSKVYEMIELVTLDYDGEKQLINRVVARTKADLYSLSSWRYQYDLERALNYIKSKAPDSAAFGSRNVMIGEAGGPANWAAPGERIAKIRQIIAQARRWGVPFITWWELAGGIGEGQNSLQTPPYEGRTRLAPYYWFYRAYHHRDDPLLIEDFEADLYGPEGGDCSQEGHSLNRVGGARQSRNGLFSCLALGGSRGQRSLYLRAGSRKGQWHTGLMRLDIRRFAAIRLSLCGNAPVTLGLTDGQGKTARVVLTPGDGRRWIRQTVPLHRFKDANRADLSALTLSLPPHSETRVDDIAFIGKNAPQVPSEKGQTGLPRIAHIPLQTPSESLPLPASTGRPLAWLRLRTADRSPIVNPRLTDGFRTLRLGRQLLPGQVLESLPGGTSHLRFGPLGHLLDVAHPEASGLEAHDLTGHPQFHSFQPGGDGSDCWLQWRWESDFPVRHFRITLYGSARSGSKASVRILVSSNGSDWQEAALDPRGWEETCWVGRPPEGFALTRSLWVRFRLNPDMSLPDWPWTVGISDFKIELRLDSEQAEPPSLRGLRYLDDSPEKFYRGLLDLDW